MKKLYVFVVLAMLAFTVQAAGFDAYERQVFVSEEGDSLAYRMLGPEQPVQGEKYPVVVFLHGAGERGTDNEKQLTHGGQMFLNPVNREKYPSIVVFPQCPSDGYWAYLERPKSFNSEDMPANPPLSPVFRTLKQLIDSLSQRPDADASRIYIMGLSMGAMGTYDMVCRYPETFAAAVAICGTVNPMRLAAAKSVPFRLFHGDADDVVTPEGSRNAYKALKALGADVEYVEFPGCNHGSWNPAFNYPDFMEWIYSKKKQ